jgi:protein TonB
VARSQLECEYCPDPGLDALRATTAGRQRRGGQNRTKLCTDDRGHVVSVRTQKSHGDPRVDRVVRDTVRRWRFRPFRVGGKAKPACSTVRFDIQFR